MSLSNIDLESFLICCNERQVRCCQSKKTLMRQKVMGRRSVLVGTAPRNGKLNKKRLLRLHIKILRKPNSIAETKSVPSISLFRDNYLRTRPELLHIS